MQIIQSTALWRRSLSERKYNDSPNQQLERDYVSRLRESFKLFHNRVSVLTGEISRSFRDLTVHDVEHTDALWQCADLLLGDDYPINSSEVYVLGGAFLLHDAGLALASYQDIREDVKQTTLWRDCAAIAFRRDVGRPIREEDYSNLPADIEQEATEFFLRQRHAQQASGLALASFPADSSGNPRYLIDDADLREAFGHLIGQIAHSHWWAIDKVTEQLSETHGPLACGPPEWHVDPLKLAVILRTCDAIQIDSRRAPALLRSLRKPTGVAENHWKFQERMMAPFVENRAVVFTSSSPFQRCDSDAWWVGKELLQLADSELRGADACLSDLSRPQLSANRVAGIQFHKQLIRFIKVDGWTPVDTSVHVSDVAKLIETLGGQGLYGDRPYVPLRELLQNARDAVVARRMKESRPGDWGKIEVELSEDEHGFVLTVSDNGIGMSDDVLAGHLLDFGMSYWKSQQALQEHPGLAALGFEPTGKYGIGFFSVFMIASSVRVVTRRPSDAQADCRVLEFAKGLKGRIILRPAELDEQLLDPGTVVSLRLKGDPRQKGGLLGPGTFWPWPPFPENQYQKEQPWSLPDLCVWLAPAFDVALRTSESGVSCAAINANDWTTIEASELIRRLLLYRDDVDVILQDESCRRIAENISPIVSQNGELIGRAAIAIAYRIGTNLRRGLYAPAEVTAGQFRAMGTGDLCGLFIGSASKASRNLSTARACLEGLPLANWATSQSRLATSLTNDTNALKDVAMLIRVLGGDTGGLPIFRDREGYKSFDDIAGQTDLPDKLELIQEHWGVAGWNPPKLKEDQLGVSSGRMKRLHDFRPDRDPRRRADHPVWNRFWMSPWGAAIEAVAQAWKVPLIDVLDAGIFRKDENLEGGGIRMTSDTLVHPARVDEPGT